MTRLQDDFYDAINGEWAKTAVIPDDKPVTGGFMDLADEIEDLMLATTDKWLAGDGVPEDDILQNFVAYHRLAADYDKREAAGIEPARAYIDEIRNLTSFEDYASKIADFELAGKPTYFPFGVAPDFMDARINVLWADGPGTILPDTTYYAEDHPQKADLLAKWRKAQEDLLANLTLQKRKSRIFWIRSWSWMLFLLSMFCLVKKALSMLSSIILISGKISKPWCRSCLWRIFSPS